MKRSLILAVAIASLTVPFGAAAHKTWLRPSQTVLAGTDPWITVDAAVSNQLYYPDHVPMRLDNIAITAPDGSVLKPQNPATGKYRSVFDVQLAQEGTYRIANLNSGISARWDTPESLAAAAKAPAGAGPAGPGGPGGPRGGFLRNASPEDLATKIPANAQNLQVTEGIGRVETFVTRGAPGTPANTGKGLELVPVTHPNVLFAGEPATCKLPVDRAPAAGLQVHNVRGTTRSRNAQDQIQVVTDANGQFSVTWPEAGMYWLEASTQDGKTSVPQASQRRLSYVATLEVLPQ